MHVIAISGPIGAPLEEFATGFAEYMGQKLHILNEKDFGTAYSPDHKKLITELAKLKSDPMSSIVLVSGHFLLTNEALRGNFKVKIFLQYEMDKGVERFINEGLSSTKGSTALILEELLTNYEAQIKPKNDEEIRPSITYADFSIPAAQSVNQEFGPTYKLLKDAIQPEHSKATQEEEAKTYHHLMPR